MKKNELDRLNSKIQQKSTFVESLRESISQVIVGQNELIDKILISIISNGHILLEGVPGLAKTLTINTVANLINAEFKRIQFTPDMLPSDFQFLFRRILALFKKPFSKRFLIKDEDTIFLLLINGSGLTTL